MRLNTPLAALVAVAAAGPLAAQDKVDGPEYASWSKFKPGTAVKYKMDVEQQGQKLGGVMTVKLLELTPEKAVIETTAVMSIMGQELKQPPQKRDVLKSVTAEEKEKFDNPKGKLEEGKEDVKAGGASYACKWVKSKREVQGKDVTATVWTAEGVPGLLVKVTSRIGGGGGTTVELVEVTK